MNEGLEYITVVNTNPYFFKGHSKIEIQFPLHKTVSKTWLMLLNETC